MSGNTSADSQSVIATLGSDSPDFALVMSGLQDVLVRDAVFLHYFENGTAEIGLDILSTNMQNDSVWQPDGSMIEEADISRVVGVMGTMLGLMLIEDNIEGSRVLSQRILNADPAYSFALLVQSALYHLGNRAGAVFRNSLAELSKDTKEPV